MRRRSTAHPEATAATEEAAGAEEGGGAARVDGDGGAPAVGDRNGGVDEDGDGVAKPKEATLGRETVRGEDDGGPELGGDGGERERRRERGVFPPTLLHAGTAGCDGFGGEAELPEVARALGRLRGAVVRRRAL